MRDTLEQLQGNTNLKDTCCTQTHTDKAVLRSYQERDDIVALLLQPDQNAGRVQSAAVGQNHCAFRHDEGCSVRQAEEQSETLQWGDGTGLNELL